MGYTKSIFRRHLQAHDYNTGSHKLICVVDKKAAATDGGGSSATTWNTRDLTDIAVDIEGKATLAANAVTLPAGKYRIDAKAPAHGAVGAHKLRVYDVTADAEIAGLISQPVLGLANLQTFASICGMFELTEESEIRIDHYTTNAVVTTGLGASANIDGGDEYYTVVNIYVESDPMAETMV